MRKDGCRLGENCHLPQKSEAWCWGRSQLQGIWFVFSLLPRLQQAWSSDLVIERELISVTAPVVYQCLSTLSTPFPGEFCHLCSREARKKKEKPKRSRPEAHDMAYHGIGPWSKSAQNALSDTKRSVFCTSWAKFAKKRCVSLVQAAAPKEQKGRWWGWVKRWRWQTAWWTTGEYGRYMKIYEDMVMARGLGMAGTRLGWVWYTLRHSNPSNGKSIGSCREKKGDFPEFGSQRVLLICADQEWWVTRLYLKRLQHPCWSRVWSLEVAGSCRESERFWLGHSRSSGVWGRQLSWNVNR